MTQTQAQKTAETLELIKLQSGVVEEASKLLGEAVESDVPDAAKRLQAAIDILRGEAPITQNEQPAAAGKTPRKSKELEPSGILSSVKNLKMTTGVVIVGEQEAAKAGVSIPAKYSQAFLNATHPIRGGTIASHAILGFDIETNQWYCIEKSIVPESRNLSGIKQDKLLQNKEGSQIEVEGVKISSPKDSKPIERLLNNVIALHLKDGKSIEEAPFRGIWGRTADTDRAFTGCRILLGFSDEFGSRVDGPAHSDYAGRNVGLLACWN